jgi:hypothetical protein
MSLTIVLLIAKSISHSAGMFSLLSVAVLTMRLGSVGALRHSFNSSALGAEESFLTQASTQAPFTAYCQWRQTGGCSPTGRREPSNDKPCTAVIPTGPSGFCDCNGNGKQDAGEEGYNCGSTAHSCLNVCQLPCKTQRNCELLPNAVCDGRSCKVKSPWTNFGGEWQHNGKLTIEQDWDKITFIPQSGPRTSLVVGGGKKTSWVFALDRANLARQEVAIGIQGESLYAIEDGHLAFGNASETH